jgi:hypothetical protein
MLVYNEQHSADVEQSTVRLVTCEQCDTDYVYQLTRSGQGYANSLYGLDNAGAKRRAKRQAKDQLARRMQLACEVVPCPECGHVQRHMFRKARSDRAFLVGLVPMATTVLTVASFVIGLSVWNGRVWYLLGVVFLLASLIGLVVTVFVYGMYNPDRKSRDARLRLAEEKAMPRKEFERSFADAAADEFDRFRRKSGKRKDRPFELAVWADRGQVKRGESLKVRLPHGEWVSLKLPAGVADGHTFELTGEADDREVLFRCVLNIYTKTQSDRG